MDTPSSTSTEYCPKDRSRHVDIRTKFPGALYCPHCAQRLPTASSSFGPITPISIDLTVDSPTSQSTVQRGNAMTIPSQRSRPRPDTYQNATNLAIESRSRSIAATSHTAKIVIESHASFWSCDGYYDNVLDGVETPVYDKTANLVGKRTGNVEIVLGAKFPSHAAMIEFIVKQCDKRLAVKEWKVVHSVVTQTATFGPVEFSDAAYETTSFADLFRVGNISLAPKRDTVHLTFWYFNVKPRPDIESPMPSRAVRGHKRAIDRIPSDLESEASARSSSKRKASRTVKSERVSPIKKESKPRKLSRIPVKEEAETPLELEGKDDIQAEIQVELSGEDDADSATFEAVLDDPFASDIDEHSEAQALSPQKRLPVRIGRGKNKNRD
ncbi:hypothetical protein BGZ61DRAFT_593619 [Ilyonectria robusta]|uniref:uncharacterized protein n=1 Tax=Ilyonectria robusta TaxID=1079257 RepID=UPI001E8D7E93|nr:uncharacterized protein BGZ61DRAFT_593619 [Ilyonectria robusta]KAH8661804.1 hypothetical protein BGZ61DRAFT_593619 [Ilyonectria robusta]